jgi:glycosyltransferase involved in cell wall biosynthesis
MTPCRAGTTGEEGVVLSIVVPMFNEEDNIEPFLARLEAVTEGLAGALEEGYEIVCVDDGSTDATVAKLLAQRKRNPAIKIVSLSRNFGKDVALSAGLDHARGSAVIPIDADLQDPPEVIPELFAKWLEGHDVVYASRASRDSDNLTKRVTAAWFYNVHNKLAEIDIPNNAGDFRLLDRRVVEALRRLPERNRFMKGLFSWVGFRQTGVSYQRQSRAHGVSKWRYWRLWNFALDGITASTTLPLRIWTYAGLGISLLAFCYAGFLIARTMIHGVDVPGYASLMVVVLMFGGINLLTLGIMGEYIGRIYTEVKARPLYLVRDLFGFEPPTAVRGEGRDGKTRDREWTARSTPAWRSSKTGTGGS